MRNEDMRPTPPEMDFTIDDILDEFGSGGSRRDPEPEPAPEPEEPTPETPEEAPEEPEDKPQTLDRDSLDALLEEIRNMEP